MASSNAAGTSGAKESSLTTLISDLDKLNVPYFYKVMTKTAVTQMVSGPMAYALGFPASFVRAHGTDFGEHSTFQPTDCDQKWPIEITIKDPFKYQVFAYGRGGWKDFVMDNNIKVGDTLLFALLAYSIFMVDIIKAAPAEDHNEEAPSLDPSSFSKNIKEASLPCERCGEVPLHSGPRFVVTVTPTNVNQLGVPGKFWQRFSDMLPSRNLELKGPNGVVMMVKAVGTFHELKQELDVYLKSRWKEFFVANDLRIDDILEFSLVGPNCFLVEVHRL